MAGQEVLAARFEEHRGRLHHLAYRMLGSDAEADDAVQDTWIRLARAGDEDIRNLGGWLATTTSRICLNLLRARATRGATDYGEHLPTPTVEPAYSELEPEAAAQLAETVEVALQWVLDSLSPNERVAFVLHDTFDVPFEQIGELLGRTPDAARQLASRARRRVRTRSDDPTESRHRAGRALVEAFSAAAQDADFDRLVALLAPDAVLRVDTGTSPTAIIRGGTQIASRALMFAEPAAVTRPVRVNGLPGLVTLVDGRPFSLMAFHADNNHITQIDAYVGPALLSTIRMLE